MQALPRSGPPSASARILVLEAEGDALRAALLARVGAALRVEGLRPLRGPEELELLSGRLFTRDSALRVALVSDAIVPGAKDGVERVVAPWRGPLAELGLALASLWPLWGLPLANLAPVPRDPCLFLQVERHGIASAELVDGVVRGLEYEPGAPTLERCLERVGPGAPEVLLAGRGLDLSQLGYEIARDGMTWVRILRPGLELPANLARGPDLGSIAGVARLMEGEGGGGVPDFGRGYLAPVVRARPFPHG